MPLLSASTPQGQQNMHGGGMSQMATSFQEDVEMLKEQEGRLPCFYGWEDRSYNWPQYMRLFEHMAKCRGWTYRQKGRYLCMRLRGDCLRVMEQLGDL